MCLAILWFFLHLAVESTIIPLELVYEHRLYLPLFAPCLLFATGLFAGTARPVSAGCVVAGICVTFGFMTWQRNTTWSSEEKLWKDNITKQPSEPRGHFNLGIVYAKTNRIEKAYEAITHSLELEPRFQQALVRQGFFLESQGKYQEALENYTEAIELKREDVRGGHAYGQAYLSRALLLRKAKRTHEALADLQACLEHEPRNGRAHGILASVLLEVEQPDKADASFRKSLELDNSLTQTHNNFAWFLATFADKRFHDGQLAVHHATIACERTKWASYPMLSTLAAAYARAGDFENAVKWQKQCNSLAPKQAQARYLERLNSYRDKTPYQQK